MQTLVPDSRSKLVGAPAFGLLVAVGLLVAMLIGPSPSAGAGVAGVVPAQSVKEELSKFGALAPVDISDIGSPGDLAPDVSLLVDRAGSTGGPEDGGEQQWWLAVRDELLGRSEVASVAVDFPDAASTVFHIGLNETEIRSMSLIDHTRSLADLVSETATDGRSVSGTADEPAVSVVAGGRALSDASIVGRFGTTVRWLAILALLLAGYAGRRLGPGRGVAMAVAWGGSVVLAGRITERVAGPFDGTVTTGPLVGAVAGLLFALVVGFRVVKWYEHPISIDGADAIRRSLAEVVSDVVLVLGGLIAVVGVLWIAGGISRAVVAVVVGGLVGAAFTGAIIAPTLAALGPGDRPVRLLGFAVPSGADLMVVTVLGLIGLLVVLSAFAFRSPGRDLVDYRSLPENDSTRVVGDRLGAGPGDPTEALVTVVETSSTEATETWARSVATFADVAWVDTSSTRFTGAGPRAVDPAQSLASRQQIGFDSVELAVIVPAVPIRSEEGARLVDDIVRLADEGVEIHSAAGPLERGSTILIIAVVVLVALAGAGTVFMETDNAGYTLTGFVLRLLGGAATVGVYRLVSAEASAAETIAVLIIVAAAVSLFELEYLHDRARFGDRWSASAGLVTITGAAPRSTIAVNGSNGEGASNGDDSTSGDETGEVDPSESRAEVVAHDGDREPAVDPVEVPGRAGLLAVAGLLIAAYWISLTRFVGGGPTMGRFGFGLAVALLIEIALGILVLRPALLGEQAAYHSVARPLRSTLHAGQRRQRHQPVSIDDPAWRRLVTDLLMAEFGLQTDPAASRVDEVFLDGTPLFAQASEQHRNLCASGLRVSGRAPQIKRVETFREGPSIMVSVTVDHPERHLVDRDGTVYGVRRAQRRSTMLWLVGLDDGAVRIAESIDMGSVPLDVDKTPDKTSFPEVATVSG